MLSAAVPYLLISLSVLVGAMVTGVGLSLIDGRTTLREWVTKWALLTASLVVVGAVTILLVVGS